MPALHDNQAAQPGPEAFEVLQGEDLRRYRAWRKRQREVLKFPACPKCGNNSQVWINQISGTLKCHRAECYVDISAAESATKLADLLDDSWPHSRAQVEQAAALMRVMANELQQLAALKKAIENAEPVAAQHQAPAQQERKPMTELHRIELVAVINDVWDHLTQIDDAEAEITDLLSIKQVPMNTAQRRELIDHAGNLTDGLDQDDFAQAIVDAVERYHGIKE